jgi:RIO kinase 1
MTTYAEDARRGRARTGASPTPERSRGRAGSATAAQEDIEEQLAPEFAAAIEFSKYERNWIREHLATFLRKDLIVNVDHRIKAGKEATVYACTGHPKTERAVIAAKLYREQSLRGSRNVGEYQDGRAMLDRNGNTSGFLPRRSDRGGARKPKAAATQISWIMHEFKLLQAMHARGGDVPLPIAHAEQALLMEFIGVGTDPAPMLNDVDLEEGEAKQLFERVVFNIELLLQLGWVHGDLSGYNMLYDRGRVVLIDFPQVVDCKNNPKARELFDRDVQRVAQCFARHDWKVDHAQLAQQLWSKHVPVPKQPPSAER